MTTGMNITDNPEDRKDHTMEEEEKEAYLYGGMNAHEYAQSIGKQDLATFTTGEWLTFCECMCKNYHLKHSEVMSTKK